MNYLLKQKIQKYLTLIFLWLVIGVVLFPIIYMVVLSGATNVNILAGRELDDLSNFATNYSSMAKNIGFFDYLKNSLIIVGITTAIALSLATLAGYSLARFKFPGANAFGITMLGAQMIPPTLTLLPLFLLFAWLQQNIGIQFTDTYHGIIIPYVSVFTPMSIWIIRGFFASIPTELEEAARIDGCTRFQAFRIIILPLAVPGIIATGIFIFLTAWDELMIASILTNTKDIQTVAVGIRLFLGQTTNGYQLLMAASVVVTLPVLFAFFALQRYFIQGMTAGAVKG